MSNLVEDIVDHFQEAQEQLVTQASDLSLETIASMVKDGSINLEPTFQRRKRWDTKDQSKLIESFLLNVPVPPVYLSESEYGYYSVIDGKQRINSITQFMTNNLKLKGLEDFKNIEGLFFSDLPNPLQNALRVRPYLRVVTLLRQSRESLKFEVFTRLNRGGEELNPQEIRNVIYRGELNKMIKELAKNDFLRDRLKITSPTDKPYRNMTDVEMVLRFFTLRERWKNFAGGYREEMNEFMQRHHKSLEAEEIDQLRKRFDRAIQYAEGIWEDKAFQRPDNGTWRNQFISGMYDAQMVAVDELEDQVLEDARDKNDKVIERTKKIYREDPMFEKSVRRATNTKKRIRYRISTMADMLKNI
jgi:hypothetical protein